MAADPAQGLRVGREIGNGLVARRNPEVVVTQLDAYGLGDVALALQVVGQLLAQAGEDGAQRRAIAHRMQVTLEGGFPADGHRLAFGDDRPLVAAPRRFMHPGAGGLAEMADQESRLLRGQLANGVDGQGRQLFPGLGADAVDLAHVERPDFFLQVGFVNDRDALGLVELAGHLGEQLVGRHADGTGQAGFLENLFLDQARQHPPALALATGHVGEVDVDLVDAAVLHQRGDLGDGALEQPRVFAHLVKIDRQHDGLRAQPGSLHHAHG